MEAEKAIELYSGTVYRLAYMYTSNFADAQDITQDVFLALFCKQPRFSCPEQERAWLIRCAKNKSLNLLRSRRSHQPVNDEIPQTGGDMHDCSVREGVLRLPDTLKSVTYLFYFEDMSVKEIAGALGISQSAVKTRLCRAREILRSLLKEEYDYD